MWIEKDIPASCKHERKRDTYTETKKKETKKLKKPDGQSPPNAKFPSLSPLCCIQLLTHYLNVSYMPCIIYSLFRFSRVRTIETRYSTPENSSDMDIKLILGQKTLLLPPLALAIFIYMLTTFLTNSIYSYVPLRTLTTLVQFTQKLYFLIFNAPICSIFCSYLI